MFHCNYSWVSSTGRDQRSKLPVFMFGLKLVYLFVGARGITIMHWRLQKDATEVDCFFSPTFVGVVFLWKIESILCSIQFVKKKPADL